MKRISVILGLLLTLIIGHNAYCDTSSGLVDYVNPLVGTDSEMILSNGNTYPAVALPWGMNFWTPQTGENGNGWTYAYDSYKIRGFKQTHQPSPWINDYGAFAIMPETGELKITDKERGSWFSHKAEISKPYYYRVYVADYDLTTEITPTERAAQFRITFPESKDSYVVVDAYNRGSYVKIIPAEKKIIGYTKFNRGGVPENFKNYFVLYFDKGFENGFTWKDGKVFPNDVENTGDHVIGIIKFATKFGEGVNIKASSSFISHDQAELNLKRELGNDTFEQTKEKAIQTWNKELGRIEIEGAADRQKRTFYTALYRTLLFPRKFYEFDKDNKLVHYSPYNGELLPGYMFTDNGFWDTFRAVFPFLTLMYPEVNSHIMAGLVNTYKESGWLPEWASPGHRNCMIGSNSASLIADSYLKGIRGYDIETLFDAILKNSENEGPLRLTSVGRYGVKYYNSLGYIPYDVGVNENVARTLEYSYDDFTIWKLAQALNKDKSIIDTFEKRAKFYQNVFDPSTNFMRGRNKNGTFQSPFRPDKWGDAFTEGCSWHWTWCVWHDPRGLIDLMGGKEQFREKLDSMFVAPPTFDYSYYGGQIHEITEMLIANMGQYAHGNQPIQHGIYLYNYAGAPWKAQYWVRRVMDQLYTPDPDGLCGDEDNGQTSAWYVFSAVGMYSVCPGALQYVLGSPLFGKITLHLENGKAFEIIAKNNSPENVYIKTAQLNGKGYTKTYLQHEDITRGGTIIYEMSNQPNTKRGVNPEDAPYSMTKTDFVAPPYVKSGDNYFLDNTTVELTCREKEAQIRYTLDGTEPTEKSALYTKPIAFVTTATIKAKAFTKGKDPSPTLSAFFEKAQLKPSSKAENLISGLKYSYYEGRFRSVDQMQNPVKYGEAKQLDISAANREEYFGLSFSGYLEIPTDGLYTFYLTSDDGSKLLIDGGLVIDNDGPHGATTGQGKIALSKGAHKLEIKYYQGAADKLLQFEWKGPGIERQGVPVEALFMKK